LLSLATFGTDSSGDILGVDLFVTFDLRLIDHFTTDFPALKRRFVRMVSHLTSPYTAAALPEVATPAEVLDALRVS
jgi:hypothetical protein